MKKLQNIIFPIVVLLLLLLINKENSNNIYINLSEAKNTSRLEDKPLLIIFENESNKNISNVKKIKEYVVCYLDYQNNKKIFEEFEIKKVPSYVIIDNRTNVIYKEEGEKNKKGLYEWLFFVKKKIRTIQKK